MADIQINELLEAQTAADSDWIAIDNGSATKKISVSNFNSTGAASAAQSAAAAAQSATDATSAKNAAVQAKDDTQALITSAQTIVSNAQTYAGEAATSANTASTAANTATAQAAIATNQANLAAGYAANVDTWAKTAKSWAVGGTGSRQGEDQDNSQYYSQQAHDSEINAAASESNASTSETNAAASESTASSAASSASTNALKAEGYAVGTQNGTPAASGETYYHDNAKYYKEEAATSATNAGSSETNAGLSEAAAAASATAAGESEDDSEAWAWGKVDGVDVPPSHPAYHNNAKYYADQASGGVSGVSSFNARTGNVVPQLGDYAANVIEFDNTSNPLSSTDVQDAIEEVQGNVETLGSSLATVATTGAYSDLSGKPTLGTAAAKDSTNAVTQSSTDLVEGGAVYDAISTGLDDKMDKANPTGTGALSLNRRSGSYVGSYSVALGSNGQANGYIAFAEGYYTAAGANYTHAAGNNTRASYDHQFVVGKFNDVKATTLFEVGNGNSETRSNAFEVYSDGTISTDNGVTKVNPADKGDLTSISETGTTASQAISSGTYFYLNGELVRAKVAIAQGATFTLNTNYEVVTAGALNELWAKGISDQIAYSTSSGTISSIAANSVSSDIVETAPAKTGYTPILGQVASYSGATLGQIYEYDQSHNRIRFAIRNLLSYAASNVPWEITWVYVKNT